MPLTGLAEYIEMTPPWVGYAVERGKKPLPKTKIINCSIIGCPYILVSGVAVKRNQVSPSPSHSRLPDVQSSL